MDGVIGEVRMFIGNFAPRNWAFCNGALVPISQNQALFSLIGTSYGGDGRTTFQLPDFRGTFPMAPGQRPGGSTYRLGQKGGSERVTILNGNLPAHTHSAQLRANSNPGTTGDPTNGYLSNTGTLDKEYSPAPSNIVNMASEAVVVGNNPTSNTALETLSPFQTIQFIICLDGIFPSRP